MGPLVHDTGLKPGANENASPYYASLNKGVHRTNYKDPEAHYEFTKKDKTWSVFFHGKVPMPGNHFLVWVDDRTQKAQFMQGE